MEVLLFLVFLGFVAVVIRRSFSKTEVTLPPADRSRRPLARIPRNFDSRTAKPLPSKPVLQGKVYVIDGDTIVISKTRIRLFGIDAPELNHPYGQKAKWEMVSLCKGQSVRAEVTETDAYGRTVARCYLQDGRDLSAELVKTGLALDWPKFSGGRYRSSETPDARKKLWLADARMKGRMHVWEQFENKQKAGLANKQRSNSA